MLYKMLICPSLIFFCLNWALSLLFSPFWGLISNKIPLWQKRHAAWRRCFCFFFLRLKSSAHLKILHNLILQRPHYYSPWITFHCMILHKLSNYTTRQLLCNTLLSHIHSCQFADFFPFFRSLPYDISSRPTDGKRSGIMTSLAVLEGTLGRESHFPDSVIVRHLKG